MASEQDLERLLNLHDSAHQAALTLRAEIEGSPWIDHCREPLAVLLETIGHQASVVSALLQETD